MKRRNTVSVTPAMGAKTVAGEMRTPPMWKDSGTRACGGTRGSGLAGFSQYLRTLLIVPAVPRNGRPARPGRALEDFQFEAQEPRREHPRPALLVRTGKAIRQPPNGFVEQ